ncbi:hypothetical protein H5410_004024 [Solanum commersonii]|uniref:Uncharacterized protein n=1 Tax=Solanum commersonii TaxID=4109 RepID=A0A9J6B6R9_SOLCO|nr:hypothetical protein H5410_004024 [Solanum commersonii]
MFQQLLHQLNIVILCVAHLNFSTVSFSDVFVSATIAYILAIVSSAVETNVAAIAASITTTDTIVETYSSNDVAISAATLIDAAIAS